MSLTVFAMVLAAAALHAVWNALVKGGADKTVSMTAVVIGQGACGGVAIWFAPPLNWECWPYLAIGVALHLGYQAFLLAAYRVGDLTQVYPIARGAAPLIVAVVSVLFLGVSLSYLEGLAIGFIAVGIMSLSLVRRGDGATNGAAAFLALVTGMFIASYSLVDGLGARIGETALGYFGWLAFLDAACFMGFAVVRRPGLLTKAWGAWRIAVIGGIASFIAYAMVVYAFTQAPIALVTALRETSIVFALLIGVVVLKERLDLIKVASTAMTLFGAALLRLSKG